MKRIYILTFLLCSISGMINAQVETHYYEKGETPKLHKSSNKSMIVKSMPPFDVEKVKKEHAEIDAKTGLRHFGKGIDVSYTLADGTWEETDGGRLWTMAFESNGALSLNFVFEDFFLPEGAELYVSNDDESIVFGPVTSEALHENGHFLTDIVSGSRAKISLFEPFECIGQSTLTIKRVVHGYRNGSVTYSANSKTRTQRDYYSGSPDVACYPDYEDVADGVGLLFTSDGEADVTCSLVMTTDYSFKPYILTTYFYIDYDNDEIITDQEKSEAENCMVKFRCRYTTCGGNIQVTSYTYNQSYFRAAYRWGGMGLLELRNSLINNPNLTWLGWNRNIFPNYPQGATLFHSDDQKLRIALCECFTSSEELGGIYWTKIVHYLGYPSGYSSGAPFLDSNLRVSAITIKSAYWIENQVLSNKSLIRPLIESWDGGLTNSTGLKHWLNPEGKNWGVMPASRVMKIEGSSQIISSRSYYIQNLPSDMTVTWSLSDAYYNQNCLQQNSPENNQCTITRSPVQEMTNAILTATLKRNGETRCTFTMMVSTSNGFDGTYYNGVMTKDINLPSPLTVLPGAAVVVTSPNLVGATVIQTGGNLTPTYLTFNSAHNKMYLGMPSSPSGAIVLGVSCSNGASYTIPITNTLINSQLSVIPSGNQLNVLLTPSSIIEDHDLGDNLKELTLESRDTDKWNLEVYNTQNGNRMASVNVSGSKHIFDTSNWRTGVYIVKATIGEKQLYEKVYVK